MMRMLLAAAILCGTAALADVAQLRVPFIQQTGSGCGSAAIAMVMEYWAHQVPGLAKAQANAERINQLLPPESIKGIHGSELKRYLQQNGFDAYVFDGEMQDLQHHLAKGRPVVVCIAPAHSVFFLHYVVMTGVDDQTVWMNDPARGELFHEDSKRFIKEWRKTDNWALLAVPHQNGTTGGK